MANKNRSAEKAAFWRLAVTEFERSGLTVRAFCVREGLAEPSFYAWRRTLQKRRAPQSQTADAPELVPVKVIESSGSPANCDAPSRLLEIVTPTGFTLRFPPEIERQQLGALLSAIAGCKEARIC